ncbi:MAG: hypothetical protein RLW61_13075 [Gammaproteobacteria bacterium]
MRLEGTRQDALGATLRGAVEAARVVVVVELAPDPAESASGASGRLAQAPRPVLVGALR